MDFSRRVIDLYRSYCDGTISRAELKSVALDLSLEMDRRVVCNESSESLESLYEDVLWLSERVSYE